MKKLFFVLLLAVFFSGCATPGARGTLTKRDPGEPVWFKFLQTGLRGQQNFSRQPYHAYDNDKNYYEKHPEKRPKQQKTGSGTEGFYYRRKTSTRYGTTETFGRR